MSGKPGSSRLWAAMILSWPRPAMLKSPAGERRDADVDVAGGDRHRDRLRGVEEAQRHVEAGLAGVALLMRDEDRAGGGEAQHAEPQRLGRLREDGGACERGGAAAMSARRVRRVMTNLRTGRLLPAAPSRLSYTKVGAGGRRAALAGGRGARDDRAMHLHALSDLALLRQGRLRPRADGSRRRASRAAGGGYRSAEYRALVPSGTIPALVDGDLVLPESDAIVSYLEEVSGRRDALPGDAAARAKARALTRIIDGRLEAKLRATFPQLKPRHPRPDRARGRARAGGGGRAPRRRADRRDGTLLAAGPAPSLADCALLATYAWCDALRPASVSRRSRLPACAARSPPPRPIPDSDSRSRPIGRASPSAWRR